MRVPGIRVKEAYNDIPTILRLSLLRAVFFFAAWHLLYFMALEPASFPDKQLIDLILEGTRLTLMPFYDLVTICGDTVCINGQMALTVYRECNGLDFVIIYAGFLMSVYKWNARLWKYISGGIIAIYALNILRCFVLAHMFYNGMRPHSFTHHQLFSLLSYALIFWMWWSYHRRDEMAGEM